MVKTTMVLPRDLWKLAKIRAAEDESHLSKVVVKALEAYLAENAQLEEEEKE